MSLCIVAASFGITLWATSLFSSKKALGKTAGAVAEVKDIHGTRVVVNNVPMVRVEVAFTTPDGVARRASFKLVSRDGVVAGGLLPIRYSVANPSPARWDPDCDGETVKEARQEQSARHGWAAGNSVEAVRRGGGHPGKVTALEPTGGIRDGCAELRISVDCEGRGTATLTRYVPARYLDALQPGRTVRCHETGTDEPALSFPVDGAEDVGVL